MEPAEARDPSTAAPAGKAASQLRKGVLEYCVLALLREGPRYAVELLRALDSGPLATSQGTVYPLLSRLRRDELVSTHWQESTSGPPRRYYALTPTGRAALAEFTGIWPEFRNAVDHFLAPSPGQPGQPGEPGQSGQPGQPGGPGQDPTPSASPHHATPEGAA